MKKNSIKEKIRKKLIEFIFGDLVEDIPEYREIIFDYLRLSSSYDNLLTHSKNTLDISRKMILIMDFIINDVNGYYVIPKNMVNYFGEDGQCKLTQFNSKYFGKLQEEKSLENILVDVIQYEHHENQTLLIGFGIKDKLERLLVEIDHIKVVIGDDEETYQLVAYSKFDYILPVIVHSWEIKDGE